MAEKKDNKRTFENVKIYGYDPNQEPNQYGRYCIVLYISQEQANFIDSFLEGSSSKKCDVNKEMEFLYTAKSKQPITLLNSKLEVINKPLNSVFIANVRLKFDDFINDEGELIKYIKPLAIRITEIIPNEAVRIFIKEPEETFEEMFGLKPKEEIGEISNYSGVNKHYVNQIDSDNDLPIDDLPF